MTSQPRNTKPVKNGSRVIGFVGTKPSGPFGHYWGHALQADGTVRQACGMHSQAAAAKHLREIDDRKTLLQRPWQVRTKNGSTVIVEAATEEQAWERGRYALRKWAEKQLEPVNARVADADIDDFSTAPLAIRFGKLEPSK